MKAIVWSFLLMTINGVVWFSDFDEAQKQAAEEHKLILLNFSGSDWCGPCIRMKTEVFESHEFLSVAESKLVLVRADFPRLKKNKLPADQVKHNDALAEKYNPSGKFPYTLLLDVNGNVINVWDGYVFSSQDQFIDELTKKLEVE